MTVAYERTYCCVGGHCKRIVYIENTCSNLRDTCVGDIC